MKVSVVILNWNRPSDTIKAVDSVLAQDYLHFDVTVWDNASTDDSKRILESRFGQDPRVRLIVSDANYGVAGGRNRAFPLAAGDLLLSLDSDAFFESPNALSLIAARMESDTSLGAVSFEVKRPDGHLMWPFSRPAAEWRSREFETIRVDGCAFAVRREAFVHVGAFAEHFSPFGAEDQHFAFKLIGDGYRILYLPSVAVVHVFSPKGRNAEQFAMHVRNMLWIPMELFPASRALFSVGKQGLSLLHDALEQRQLWAFVRGSWYALTGFRWGRRQPMDREVWRHLRQLIREDRAMTHLP